ncbi:MAG: sensor domain-containing diguanylate cyclase [Elusimicrobiota bacterium]|jgi:diguanylate cyclase (GGDEF)-like protein
MLSHRNLTLLGSNLLFFGVAAGLFLLPGWEVVLYPLFGLVFIWNDFRREEEVHVIFLFLSTVAAALCMARRTDPAYFMALGAEAGAMWLLSFGLSFHRSRMDSERNRILGELGELETSNRDFEREKTFYETYQGSAVSQIQLRRDLTQAAKALGSTMDEAELAQRLKTILETRYKESRVKLLTGVPSDPLVNWAVRSNAPVLVRDVERDERFAELQAAHSFRSALLVPINVQHKPYGFVRVEADAPRAFSTDDLRTVDLFSTVAALTLENIRLYQEVSEMALRDGLTGLYTQRTFRFRLKDELLRAGRSQSPLVLIMADIDHFKGYNDTYGHPAGDELLRVFARILTANVRPVDCVARYGGEEFALILPSTPHAAGVENAGRIRAAIAEEDFTFQGRRSRVTASFGVASFPQDGTSLSQLIRAADERLYRSKNGGRNQVSG